MATTSERVQEAHIPPGRSGNRLVVLVSRVRELGLLVVLLLIVLVVGVQVPEFLTAVSKNPTALHKYHLAMAYFRSGDPKHGSETLQSALKMNPDLPEAKLARQLQVEARQN